VSAMSDTTTINHEVDAATYRRFKQLLGQKHGSAHGRVAESLEEAMALYVEVHENGDTDLVEEQSAVLAKLGNIEARLDSLETLERERHNPTAASTASVGTETEQKLSRMVNNLPDSSTVSETVIEAVIEDEGLSSYKTLKKYKRLMQNRGEIVEHPDETGTFFTSPRSFAIWCEQSPDVTPQRVDYLVGQHEEILGDGWYAEALPSDFKTDKEGWLNTKYAQAVANGAHELTERYVDGEQDHNRTFQ